jgi:hypothetical protein
MSFVHSPKIVTDGLVLALDAGNTKSYPGSGTTWYDKSGNARNGTLINGPTFSSANGGSIVFDGTDDKVQFSSALLTGTGDFTLSSWVKRSTPNTIDYIMGNYGLANDGVELYYNTNNISFYSNGIYVTSPITHTDTNWHLISATRISGTASVYFDITLEKTGSLNVNIPGNNPFTLGNGYDYNSEALIGNIAVSLIYNKGLSASEIQQNFNALRGRYGI